MLRLAVADGIPSFLTTVPYGTLKVPLEVFSKLIPKVELFEGLVHDPSKQTKMWAYM